MAIVRETVVYDGPGGPFEGVMAYEDEVETPRAGVLVVPNVLGEKEADNQKAEALAGLGYVAFACDVFGQGRRKTRESDNASEYMDELRADRGLLSERLAASLDVLAKSGRVQPGKLAAIGFCFGGLCVLDMARSGLPILAGVSFHGVYARPDYPSVHPIRARLLLCHGWDDPLGPPEMVKGVAEELTGAGADWQLHAYGHAGHAFTDTGLAGERARPGMAYEPRADHRSWAAMQHFLAEVLV